MDLVTATDLVYDTRRDHLYPIYVPSAFRAGTAPLLNMLSEMDDDIQARVFVVTDNFEMEGYLAAYPKMNIVEKWANPARGLGAARESCLHDAHYRGFQRIVMIDDDIRKVSLLFEAEPKKMKRLSASVLGWPLDVTFLKGLAYSCLVADHAFDHHHDLLYGSLRNALFSNGENPEISYSIGSGSFPSCTMVWDVDRYIQSGVKLQPEFLLHGEDLGLFVGVLTSGYRTFLIRSCAYDQDGSIETTIPLDPNTEEGRQIDWDNAMRFYPWTREYLRSGAKNKLGGTIRVGFNWRKFNKDTGRTAVNMTNEEVNRELS